MRKSSGWWRWMEKSPGCSSNEAQKRAAVAETAGRVPMMEATIARRNTASVSSIWTLRGISTCTGSEGSTARGCAGAGAAAARSGADVARASCGAGAMMASCRGGGRAGDAGEARRGG
jgi:hypothetical protein